MDICGIVAEYNPFHSGHLYHIAETRKAGADFVVAVMSGSFVQRAEPALLSKFTRARLAVMGGADLVIELPCQYAASSSERFAFGAASALAALGCVGALSFGSESGELSKLTRARDAVLDEKAAELTKRLCESGRSYPAAREEAVRELFGSAADVLSAPNDILAVEYLKAISSLGISMEPRAVARAGARHDEGSPEGAFASASFIRERARGKRSIEAYVPEYTARAVKEAEESGRLGMGLPALSQAAMYKLRSTPRGAFSLLPDCADGLGDRLYAAAGEARNIEEVLETAKTKRYTMSRVRRAVVSALLDIDASYYFSVPYIRVLAIGKNAAPLLKEIKRSAALPLSHSLKALSGASENAAKTAALESRAFDLFSLSLASPYPRGFDYTEKLYSEI